MFQAQFETKADTVRQHNISIILHVLNQTYHFY